MGTRHGAANPYWRPAVVTRSRREGVHRRADEWDRSLLLHRSGDALPHAHVRRCAHDRHRCYSGGGSKLGQRRNEEEWLADRIAFICADVCDSPLANESADFIWGEDAWCYVLDKPRLIAEAARLVKVGGVIAFTDWVDGPVAMNSAERARLLAFMKFPNLQSIDGYRALLAAQNCSVQFAENTGRFAPYIDLYLNMLTMQLTYDALKIIGFDMDMMTCWAVR